MGVGAADLYGNGLMLVLVFGWSLCFYFSVCSLLLL
jgi:hypothetical protein